MPTDKEKEKIRARDYYQRNREAILARKKGKNATRDQVRVNRKPTEVDVNKHAPSWVIEEKKRKIQQEMEGKR